MTSRRPVVLFGTVGRHRRHVSRLASTLRGSLAALLLVGAGAVALNSSAAAGSTCYSYSCGWSLSLSATPQQLPPGAVFLDAEANQDLAAGPGQLAIYIFDESSDALLISCVSGSGCQTSTTDTDGGTYIAYVAAASSPLITTVGQLTNIQAVSTQVTPLLPGGPLPLIIAHGITGSAAGERPAQGFAKATVPGLNQPGFVVLANTGATSSVWDNAAEIVSEAVQTLQQTGEPAVNVLAHSKGGLDTRVAMAEDPWLFNSLGMLSTPNGGSGLADKLCKIRRIPFVGKQVMSQFGPCHNDNDGLFDLQTFYVKNTINGFAPDNPELSYYDLGSNCSTKHTTFFCNGADNLGLNCPNGGDSAVCLNSAYWLTPTWPNVAGGLQVELLPLQGYKHSQMNSQPCPVTDVLAALYPLDSQGNPWIGGDGNGCENIGSQNVATDFAIGGSPVKAQPAAMTLATTPMAASGPNTSADSSTVGPVADQTVISGGADPADPFVATLNPEGGDTMTATVFIPAGVTPSFAVTMPSGAVDPSATVDLSTDTDGVGAQIATIALTGLAGTTRTLTVGVDVSSAIGLTTQVASPTALAVTASASSAIPGDDAVVSATLAGLTTSQAQAITVSATYTNAGGTTVTTPLTYSTATASYTAPISVAVGDAQPIDVTATGANFTRFASTGIVLANGVGIIGHVNGDSLVDINSSGTPDDIQLPVQVTTTQAGTYQLSVALASGGRTVATGTGQAVLGVGSGSIVVNIPLAELLATGAPSGTFEVVNGVLTEGTSGRTLIARAADMGPTSSYNLDTYAPPSPVLSRLTATALDTNHDGLFDDLRVSGAASVATAGSYRLTGALEGPNGAVLDQISVLETLAAGRNPLQIDLPGTLIGGTGSGTYELTGVTLQPAAGLGARAAAQAMFLGPFDASEWVGGPGCVLCVLAPTRAGALTATGAATITWAGTAVVNSTSTTAVQGSGSARLSGGELATPGAVKLAGTASLVVQLPTAVRTAVDPLAGFSLATVSGTPSALTVTGSNNVVAAPGLYSTISVSGAGRLDLQPGVYVVTGGLTVSGSGALTGTGVTIYLACPSYPAPCAGKAGAGLTISGASTVSLGSAANNPVVLSDPTNAAPATLSGSATVVLTGTVDAAAAPLTLSGTATMTVGMGQLVFAQITASGSAAVNVTGLPPAAT